MAKKYLHNISRNTRQNLWQVRVMRNGVQRSKSFSDSKMPLGSEAVGLMLAMEYRDEMLSVPFKKFVKNY